MDDLFDGYIVLDGIGDFLGNSVPASDPKAPDVVPQTIHHARVSKQPIRPKENDVNGSDQSYASHAMHRTIPNSNVAAPPPLAATHPRRQGYDSDADTLRVVWAASRASDARSRYRIRFPVPRHIANYISVQRHGLHARTAISADVSVAL